MNQSNPLVSVVVIGRNEGERLVRCLRAVQTMSQKGFRLETIYVDSGSTDGSVLEARAMGVSVLALDIDRPSAALGRNLGWQAAKGQYIMFLDGDTCIHPLFVHRALQAMSDPRVAVVWGHRREMRPEQSVYVRVMDLDWIYPPGESMFCGGDALMRRQVLIDTGGFDDHLIAGEEPELCQRIRSKGHAILHIDAPMTLHDLAITCFEGYWRRAYRAGHAYAEVAARFRHTEERLWRKEVSHNFAHGLCSIGFAASLLACIFIPAMFLPLLGLVALLLARSTWRCRWKSRNLLTCFLYAAHSHFQHIPIMLGQLSHGRDVRRGRRRRLIEYRRSPS